MSILFNAMQSKGRENPKRNKSGLLDLTAYEAIKKVDTDLEIDRLHKMIDILHSACEINDFCIIEHVVLKDKRTGKVWR